MPRQPRRKVLRARTSPPQGDAPRSEIALAETRVLADASLAESSLEYDPDVLQRQRLDRFGHAVLGRMTFGISPAALGLAWADWASHLAVSPGKQTELWQKATRKWVRLGLYAGRLAWHEEDGTCIEPLEQDKRFAAEEWRQPPYALISQSFLLMQQWFHNVVTGVRGVSSHHEDVLAFSVRQALDIFAPTNFIPTNPVVLKRTLASGGLNLAQGLKNLTEDAERAMRHLPPPGAERFRVGKNLAVTPGKVVFRNRLIELIQYAPTTESIQSEPILFVPAWIMKYYILDLSPENSLVRFLVDQGHTVFMISWKNPTAEDRDLGLQDYVDLGARAAIDAVHRIVGRPIHLAGYCLGGTLAAITAAAMARNKDDRLASLTLLAAQTDFTQAGELMLFIDESQVAYLEDMMWSKGFLDTRQMSGAFHLLRSNDLIWSQLVHEYLMGERRAMTDMMAWNADATRMPYRMHSEYLRGLFLENALAEGRFRVDGRPISIEAITLPVFAVGTEHDHIAPWRSVFMIHNLVEADVTFALASAGHNAGIVSPPGMAGTNYRIATSLRHEVELDPDNWLTRAEKRQGSWWGAWQDWLAGHSSGQVRAATRQPSDDAELGDAPGTYVVQK